MYVKQRNLHKNQRLGSFEGESLFGGRFAKRKGRFHHTDTSEGLAKQLTHIEMKKKHVEERRARLEADRQSGKLTEVEANRIEDRLNKKLARLAKREAKVRAKLGQQTMSGLGDWSPAKIGGGLAALGLGVIACLFICKKL